MRRKLLGRRGEEAAAQYLTKKGYRILHKNYRCPLGEVDLIARDGDVLVFVEVRSRSGDQYGLGQESIGTKKKNKLRQLAWQYLKRFERGDCACRFDVVAILFESESVIKDLEHIENAF